MTSHTTRPAQKAVFFMRAYNDMDHLTPVLWKLATTTDLELALVIRLGKSALDDYRIQFLQTLNRITIHHISEFGLDAPNSKDESKPAPLTGFARVQQRIKRLFAPAAPVVPASKIKHQVDAAKVEAMMDALFNGAEQGIVVFDWVSLSLFHRNFADAVIASAGQRGYANLSLPHGDSPYYNQMFKSEDIDYSAMEHYKENPFDVVVVPNPLTARRYSPFRDENQLKVIGSARYNDEWMGVLAGLLPTFDAPAAQDKLKVVLFLRNSEFPIFWEEVLLGIQLVTQFPDVHLVVKHHTRGGTSDHKQHREHLEMSKLNQMTAPNLQIVYNDVHSGALLQWADAVLELGTSISFEAVKLNKPLLALEYMHANISTTAHYLPKTAIQCRDQLYDAVMELRQAHTHRLYNEAERAYFMREVIDYPDENVLARYADLVVTLMQSQRPTSTR